MIMEGDAVAFNFIKKVCVGVIFRLAAASRDSPEDWHVAGLSESCAEVADDILKLATSAPIAHEENLVVAVLYIPVVQKRHHHFQSLKGTLADERVIFPLPFVKALDAFGPGLEAHVLESAVARNGYARHKVVDLGYVSYGPEQAYGGGFRLCLLSYLRDPLAPRSVANAKLFGIAALLLSNKGYLSQIRFHCGPARPKIKVARRDAGGLAPQDGRALWRLFLLRFTLNRER